MGKTRARRGVEEWVDTTRIAWSEVTGLYGFGEGSCDDVNCGSGIVIMAYSDVHGWSTFNKKCGPVPGVSPWMPSCDGYFVSLDGQLGVLNSCVNFLTTVVVSLRCDESFRWYASHSGCP